MLGGVKISMCCEKSYIKKVHPFTKLPLFFPGSQLPIHLQRNMGLDSAQRLVEAAWQFLPPYLFPSLKEHLGGGGGVDSPCDCREEVGGGKGEVVRPTHSCPTAP